MTNVPTSTSSSAGWCRWHRSPCVGSTWSEHTGPVSGADRSQSSRCKKDNKTYLRLKIRNVNSSTCTSHSSQLEWDQERWDWRTWTPLAFCSGWQGGWWQGWRLHRTGTHQVAQVCILKNVFNFDGFKMLPKCKVVFCKTRSVVCTCITARGAGQADVQSGVGRGPSLQRVRVCDLRQDKVNNVLYN